MIDKVIKSPNTNKRFRAIIGAKHIDFGSPNAYTYVDGADENKRFNYLKRHSNNPLERNKINDFTKITASLLAAHLLWGESKSIQKNLDKLNSRLRL